MVLYSFKNFLKKRNLKILKYSYLPQNKLINFGFAIWIYNCTFAPRFPDMNYAGNGNGMFNNK